MFWLNNRAMNWKYRITDIKAQGNKAYVAYDISNVKDFDIPEHVDYQEVFYDLPSPIAPFYSFVLNREEVPTLDQLLRMYQAMYGGANPTSTHNMSGVDPIAIRTHVVNYYRDLCRHLKLYLALNKSGEFEKVSFSFKLIELYGVQYELKLNGNNYWLRLGEPIAPLPEKLPANTCIVSVSVGDIGSAAASIRQTIDLITNKGNINW